MAKKLSRIQTTSLQRSRRREIDAAFRGMADDEQYQRLSEEIAESFAQSDWEALLLGTSTEET